MLLTVLLVISMTAAVGAIYKWVDEKGRIQFSDKPPTEGKAESLTIEEQRSRPLTGVRNHRKVIYV